MLTILLFPKYENLCPKHYPTKKGNLPNYQGNSMKANMKLMIILH